MNLVDLVDLLRDRKLLTCCDLGELFGHGTRLSSVEEVDRLRRLGCKLIYDLTTSRNLGEPLDLGDLLNRPARETQSPLFSEATGVHIGNRVARGFGQSALRMDRGGYACEVVECLLDERNAVLVVSARRVAVRHLVP